jgi:predicted DNA-binding transcriptional regulator YafY
MVALSALATSPFHDSATSALRKVVAVTDDRSLRESADLAAHIHLLGDEKPTGATGNLAAALRTGQVLRISYTDRDGGATEREVEPMGFVGKGDNWYLVAWCRLRNGLRAFRGDRISRAEPLSERAPRRTLRVEDLGFHRRTTASSRVGSTYALNTDTTLSRVPSTLGCRAGWRG